MPDDQSRVPSWSVVICAFTEVRWAQLREAVASVLAQTVRSREVVIVIDHNPGLMERAQTELAGGPVRVVANREEQGLSGARNTGVEEARGEYVAFLDDDAFATTSWLEKLAAALEDPTVVGVGGAVTPLWRGCERPRWLPEEFYWVIGCSYKGLPNEAAPIRNPIGCNMAFRRNGIVEVGGFSSRLGRVGSRPVGDEETDIAIRIQSLTGMKVMYAPEAEVAHAVTPERVRISYFARRCFGEGLSKARLVRRVGFQDATSSERTYVFRTLTLGLASHLRTALTRMSRDALLQSIALVAGLGFTAVGFAFGALRR